MGMPLVVFVCLCLQVIGLCNGLPINLENTTAADASSEILPGLYAALLAFCSVLCLAVCLCCQRRNGFKEFRDSPVVASTVSNIDDHGHVNPVANGEFTIFTPLSPPHHNNNVFLANQSIITRTHDDYIYGNVDVSSWFDGTEKEFPRIKLKYIRELGQGWFGRVVEGAAQELGDKPWTPVAVRILDSTASSKERIVFLHDAAVYRCGRHPNILGLMGRCLDTVPLLLLQEYCPQGDLKKYLRENKATADKLLSTEYPLVWCCQLTSALKHLHDHKLTHPDLAARNCQLSSNLTLKLGDYGLSAHFYPEDYYPGVPSVPVRWCAPESLHCTADTIEPLPVTPEANVWALGVTMWEVCQCGVLPYHELSDDEVLADVVGGKGIRLPRPGTRVVYTDYMYRLMQLCWTTAESRPAIAQINLMLCDLLQVHKNTTNADEAPALLVEDFDKRWESFKPNTIVKTDNHNSADEKDFDDDISDKKPMSPSLNNLHGSLDNLAGDVNEGQMESWLENVASKTGDMSFVRGLSDAIKDLDSTLEQENVSSSGSSHQQSPGKGSDDSKARIDFKLGPLEAAPNETRHQHQNDSFTDSLLFVQRASSESDTEEENWKRKIERGDYSEKVRQKSKSVQDLMVLTHIECSESESETPLPSLDHRINYRNVRYAVPKQNLESMSLTFGSEGNLLNVEDKFKKELKKLKEEHKDSLLFVPDSVNNDNRDELEEDKSNSRVPELATSLVNNNFLQDSPSKRIFEELNSTSEMKPVNQVYNVFNVTINKYPLSDVVRAVSEHSTPKKKKKNGFKESEIPPKLSDIIRKSTDLESIIIDAASFNIIKERNNLPDIISDIHEKFPICDFVQQSPPPETIDQPISDKVPSSPQQTPVNNQSCEEANIRENLESKLGTENIFVNRPIEVDLDYLEIIISDLEPNCDGNLKEETIAENSADVNNKNPFLDEISERNSNPFTSELNDSSSRDLEPLPEISKNEPSLDSVKQDGVDVAVEELSDDAEIEVFNNNTTPCEKTELFISEFDDRGSSIGGDGDKSDSILLDKLDEFKSVNISSHHVPKLKDIIENNDFLMEYIIATYGSDESELDNQHAQDNIIDFEGKAIDIPDPCDESQSKGAEIENLQQEESVPKILDFDLSDNQDEITPNSLTHSTIFSSTPFGKMSLQEVTSIPVESKYSSLNIFNREGDPDNFAIDSEPPRLERVAELSVDSGVEERNDGNVPNLNYSLETWDNFLERTLDNQSESQDDDLFDSFTSQTEKDFFETPQNETASTDNEDGNRSRMIRSETFTIDDGRSGDLENGIVDLDDIKVEFEEEKNEIVTGKPGEPFGTWEAGGGWFLHPQSGDEEVTGEMVVSQAAGSDSYVGFGNMDDEIMAAIRNELITKLPQAQNVSADKSEEEEEEEDDLDFPDHTDMIHLKYNLYKVPLSPILEESFSDDDFDETTYHSLKDPDNNDSDSDWLEDEPPEPAAEVHNKDSDSGRTCDSPIPGPLNNQTLSQDSCCSNDTLFNLEDLTCVNEQDKQADESSETQDESKSHTEVATNCDNTDDATINNDSGNDDEGNRVQISDDKHSIDQANNEDSAMGQILSENVYQAIDKIDKSISECLGIGAVHSQVEEKSYLTEFLNCERKCDIVIEDFSNKSDSLSDTPILFNNKHVAPLPSPEDNPWKQLPASQLSYEKIAPQNATVLQTVTEFTTSNSDNSNSNSNSNTEDTSDLDNTGHTYVNETPGSLNHTYVNDAYRNDENLPHYENMDLTKDNVAYYDSVASCSERVDPDYENSDIYNEADYANVNYENVANVDYENSKNLGCNGSRVEECYGSELIIENGEEELQDDVFGVLTDIRFNGPGDQLMSTSFSESNDNDDQEWDSGSDSRSSSSGEFIWKEGEHEESLKALHAAPQDVQSENIRPLEEIEEESDGSTSCSDDEGDSPEFVPSAWDKYATPTKSALRSPEKTIEKSEKKKSKGVWFKKQKYHCVYEYPKEPESPVLHSLDIWTPQTDYSSFADWEFDSESFTNVPPTEDVDFSQYFSRPQSTKKANMYQLTTVPDFTNAAGIDDEFYISSSSKPFDGLSSQFFPGNSAWFKMESATPDSGVEDVTPGSLTENDFRCKIVNNRTVQSLRTLASNAIEKEKQMRDIKSSDVLGGLRHTRNKLKLDLPASPNAFSTSKMFTIEAALDTAMIREKPSFTTFGKSRFSVQQVDTPPECDSDSRNVSFEALPHKPMHKQIVRDDEEKAQSKGKVEIVRGEASLLDSADEDSGIESSTLERKLSNTVEEV